MPSRTPFTDEQLSKMKPSELLRHRLSDDEMLRLRSINEKRKEQRERRSALLSIQEKPMLAELRAIGVNFESVWNLIGKVESHTAAIPALLRHLVMDYPDPIKDGIARALAVPHEEVRKAWHVLVTEYKKAPIGKGLLSATDTEELQFGAKNGLARTLAATVSEETLPELIEIVRDSTHGTSRVLLLSALKERRKNPGMPSLLMELKNDPDLEKEIISWH